MRQQDLIKPAHLYMTLAYRNRWTAEKELANLCVIGCNLEVWYEQMYKENSIIDSLKLVCTVRKMYTSTYTFQQFN